MLGKEGKDRFYKKPSITSSHHLVAAPVTLDQPGIHALRQAGVAISCSRPADGNEAEVQMKVSPVSLSIIQRKVRARPGLANWEHWEDSWWAGLFFLAVRAGLLSCHWVEICCS